MKYIDADKFIEVLEEMKKAEYENCGGVNAKTRILQEVQELIPSLQQEQPEVDLEVEIKKMLNSDYYKRHIKPSPYTIDLINYTARHFFELGLNAINEK